MGEYRLQVYTDVRTAIGASPSYSKVAVAVEVSVKLSQKYLEEGIWFMTIREVDLHSLNRDQIDALGGKMLSRLGDDPFAEILQSLRTVVEREGAELITRINAVSYGAKTLSTELNATVFNSFVTWWNAAGPGTVRRSTRPHLTHATPVEGLASGHTFTGGEEIPRRSMRSLTWASPIIKKQEQRRAGATKQQPAAETPEVPDEKTAKHDMNLRRDKDKSQQCCQAVPSSSNVEPGRAISTLDTIEPGPHAHGSSSQAPHSRDRAAELARVLESTRRLRETLRKARAEGQATGLAAGLRGLGLGKI
ncbi:hypothetical protein LTR95_006807 [Oleoguttula sp. CCFEE 5521]